MFDNEISMEQRVHDLALHATILHYQQNGIDITESNAFEYGIYYRRLLDKIRSSISEGKSDL